LATDTRNPTSDEAASGTLSGSAGSRFTLVDDYPDTTGADILTFGTATAQITFGFSAFTIPTASTSISVQVQYYDGEAANGANNCGGRLKVGGSYFNATTHNPAGTTYTSRSDNFANNPQTAAAWTGDQINGIGANALQAFGIGSTDSNPTFRVSCVRIQVTYTPPTSSGTHATTASVQTAASSGAVEVAGTSAAAAAAQEAAATGTVEGGEITGTAATTASAQTAVATGTASIEGASAATSSAQTAAASGAVAIAGAASTTSSAETAAIAGTSTIGGTSATVALTQYAAASGEVEGGGDNSGPQRHEDSDLGLGLTKRHHHRDYQRFRNFGRKI